MTHLQVHKPPILVLCLVFQEPETKFVKHGDYFDSSQKLIAHFMIEQDSNVDII